MKNNKGQSLVIFVLLLPLIILFLTYVFDTLTVQYEKGKLQDIKNMIIDMDDEVNNEGIKELVNMNDKDISITFSNNKIILTKKIKSLFGNIVGKEYYDININVEK